MITLETDFDTFKGHTNSPSFSASAKMAYSTNQTYDPRNTGSSFSNANGNWLKAKTKKILFNRRKDV